MAQIEMLRLRKVVGERRWREDVAECSVEAYELGMTTTFGTCGVSMIKRCDAYRQISVATGQSEMRNGTSDERMCSYTSISCARTAHLAADI